MDVVLESARPEGRMKGLKPLMGRMKEGCASTLSHITNASLDLTKRNGLIGRTNRRTKRSCVDQTVVTVVVSNSDIMRASKTLKSLLGSYRGCSVHLSYEINVCEIRKMI